MLMMWTQVDGNNKKVIRMPYLEIEGKELHAPLFMLDCDIHSRRGLRITTNGKDKFIMSGSTVKMFMINQTINIHQWEVLVPGMMPAARFSLLRNMPSHITDYVTIHAYSASFAVYDHYIENVKQWLEFINSSLSGTSVKQIERFVIDFIRKNNNINRDAISPIAAKLEKIKSRMLHANTIEGERKACENMYRTLMLKTAKTIKMIRSENE